jgi:hypothetical protein
VAIEITDRTNDSPDFVIQDRIAMTTGNLGYLLDRQISLTHFKNPLVTIIG